MIWFCVICLVFVYCGIVLLIPLKGLKNRDFPSERSRNDPSRMHVLYDDASILGDDVIRDCLCCNLWGGRGHNLEFQNRCIGFLKKYQFSLHQNCVMSNAIIIITVTIITFTIITNIIIITILSSSLCVYCRFMPREVIRQGVKSQPFDLEVMVLKAVLGGRELKPENQRLNISCYLVLYQINHLL